MKQKCMHAYTLGSPLWYAVVFTTLKIRPTMASFVPLCHRFTTSANACWYIIDRGHHFGHLHISTLLLDVWSDSGFFIHIACRMVERASIFLSHYQINYTTVSWVHRTHKASFGKFKWFCTYVLHIIWIPCDWSATSVLSYSVGFFPPWARSLWCF